MIKRILFIFSLLVAPMFVSSSFLQLEEQIVHIHGPDEASEEMPAASFSNAEESDVEDSLLSGDIFAVHLAIAVHSFIKESRQFVPYSPFGGPTLPPPRV